MKKTLLAIFLIVSALLSAQKVKFGAKAGLNVSTLTGDLGDTSSKAGFYGGVYTRIPISSSKFSFQPEILFSMQGAKEKDSYTMFIEHETIKANYKFNYINIPLMLQYEIIPGLRGEFGPQFGFIVTKKYDIDNYYYYNNILKEELHISGTAKNLKTFDFGLNVGANYELKNGVNFSARYNFGLTNLIDDSDYSVKNSVFSIGVGYTLK